MKKTGTAAVAGALALSLAACGSDPTTQRTTTGAAIGTAGGALIGSLTGDAGWGALIGAGAGAAGGYLYDRYDRDRSERAYRGSYRGAYRGEDVRYYDRRSGRSYYR